MLMHMARRPLHLRWIYVRNHPALFIVLTLGMVVGVVATVLLATDPARGLMLGAMPVLYATAVWALTNRATYPDRTPRSRVPFPDSPDEPASPAQRATQRAESPAAQPPLPAQPVPSREGDPFAASPPLTPAESARRSAAEQKHARRRKGRRPSKSATRRDSS